VLLLGGGLYVFFAGMSRIGWDLAALLGTGASAHLMTSASHEVPWTALTVLMVSTNVWYYATNQYINQRCLAARDEWHAKMGVLFAVALQILIPLATCFPGMIYRVLNPTLENPDAAYPMVVAAVVPEGLRGLVVAAVLSAIMSTVSGLVNSTSTMVTLDIIQRWGGRTWSEERLVRVGRWSGAAALLIGALFAPLVMKWENIFRYAQDLWAPMAAPVVVVFLAGALWTGARPRGALACLWLAILTVPLILLKAVLADAGLHFLPRQLENPMVFAGAAGLIGLAMMIALSRSPSRARGLAYAGGASVVVLGLGAVSPAGLTLALVAATLALTLPLMAGRRTAADHLWDRSMLVAGGSRPWYARLGLWWSVLAAILVGIYAAFW
jgi:SSS family solute:Na+ symporter